MRRLLRAVLACLLSLGIAVQGFAGAATMQSACDLHHHGAAAHQAQAAQAHAQHASAHDQLLHQDHGAQASQGAAADDPAFCSCLAGCHAVSSLPVSFVLRVQVALTASPAPAWTATSFRSLPLPAHWRPPAAT